MNEIAEVAVYALKGQFLENLLGHLRLHFIIFVVDGSMKKLTSKSNFSLLSSFLV